jgi:EAL domain-containing protein (putative c-di-GMP-specific phosphodiesterase class I)
MLKGLRELFSSGPAPYADADEPIPLGEVLKRNWLELWYQPKIDLRNMQPVGAEALVRARHPGRGVVAPHIFLSEASEADLLTLSERVILTALQDWELFARQGVAMKLAVNVPPSALVKLPLAQILREARPSSGKWPGLVFEVAEEQIIGDLPLAEEIASALRSLDCTLALDDFGAGYSALSRLRQLPFSELKIDRMYVMNCHRDQRNADLCMGTIALGQRFGLSVVAEGIETVHESQQLQSFGCHIGQGFLFAKPMPKGQLIGLMRRQEAAVSNQ